MDWRVVKIGAEMFDMLHTYGLSIVLAYATQAPVQVCDEGCFYHLTSACSTLPSPSLDILDELFLLPEVEEVVHPSDQVPPSEPASLASANLDGLLAALFTNSQGVRECSIWSLLDRQCSDSTVIERALLKVSRICDTWKEWIEHHVHSPSQWLEDVLVVYDPQRPVHPLPVPKRYGMITLPMTLEPSLSYASRQPSSDGSMTHKNNMTIAGTHFATILAYIGAMRFLRAQPAAGNLIAYTVPLVRERSIERESRRTVFRPRGDDGPEVALLLQWLGLALGDESFERRERGLAFQILQAQGKQPAISRSRGTLDLSWLFSLKYMQEKHLLRFWQWVLSRPQKESPYERHALVEALLTHQRGWWETHLFDVAQAELARHPLKDQGVLRLYSVEEVRKVIQTMQSTSPSPLSRILDRKEGTLRFGHALRQLKDASTSSNVCELLEELASVRTRDQLFDILTQLMEICEVLDAKTYFLITPSDDDLKLLLTDEEQYSAQTIAQLLRLLSTLHYPIKEDEAEGRQDSYSSQ